jgi:hypothetical protein
MGLSFRFTMSMPSFYLPEMVRECTDGGRSSPTIYYRFRLLVASPPTRDLLFFAKDLFVAAMARAHGHVVERKGWEDRQPVVLYVLALVAVVVGVDVLLFRNRFWERLIMNVGIVLIRGVLSEVPEASIAAPNFPPLLAVRRRVPVGRRGQGLTFCAADANPFIPASPAHRRIQ